MIELSSHFLPTLATLLPKLLRAQLSLEEVQERSQS